MLLKKQIYWNWYELLSNMNFYLNIAYPIFVILTLKYYIYKYTFIYMIIYVSVMFKMKHTTYIISDRQTWKTFYEEQPDSLLMYYMIYLHIMTTSSMLEAVRPTIRLISHWANPPLSVCSNQISQLIYKCVHLHF